MSSSSNLRLERVAIKSGLTLGLMSECDRARVLAFAAIHFLPGRIYDEKSVNAVLRDWLPAGGAMLRSDHVELRRWLVDTGWLVRDGYGRRYELSADAAPRAQSVLGDATAESLRRLVTDARRRDAEQRADRRRRYLGDAPAAVVR